MRPPLSGDRRDSRQTPQRGSRQANERRRVGRTRSAIVTLAIGVAALCAAGAGFGAYAALGDGAGPAALGGQIGIATPNAQHGDVVAEGAPDPGEVDGTPVTDPPASEAPPATQPPVTTPPGQSPQPTPPAEAAPPVRDPSDPLSPEYNPYTTPGDPAYVPEEVRAEWLGRQAVIRQCMTAAGFEYLEWQWWEGGSPMPAGLSPEAEAAWLQALRGDAAGVAAETPETPQTEAPETPTPSPGTGPEGGCEQVGQEAAQDAEAGGAPLTEPIPARSPAAPTERETWLAFQDAVRACMRDQGYTYEYWEYWNPADQGVNGSPAMPAGLTDAERADWNTAAFGSPDASGAEQPIDGGGCWTTGAEAVDYREFQ
jgi:hypothetical protein